MEVLVAGRLTAAIHEICFATESNPHRSNQSFPFILESWNLYDFFFFFFLQEKLFFSSKKRFAMEANYIISQGFSILVSIVNVVTIYSIFRSRGSPELCQSVIQDFLTPGWPQMTPGWPQDEPRMTPGWHQDDPRMTLGWHQDDPRMTLGWL